MPFTVAGKNKMLDALGATHMSPFSGDPSDDGTELSDKQTITMLPPSNGSIAPDLTSPPGFVIAPGQTVNYAALWDADGGMVAFDAVAEEYFENGGVWRPSSGLLFFADPS